MRVVSCLKIDPIVYNIGHIGVNSIEPKKSNSLMVPEIVLEPWVVIIKWLDFVTEMAHRCGRLCM